MKALVLCGGMSQKYLIKLLKERGITAIVADMNPKAPAVEDADAFFPVSTLDVDGIRNLAKAEKVDFIISVCADQMLLVAAQVSEELGLPCYISYETGKNVSSKEYMKDIFVKNNIPTARHVVMGELDTSKIAHLTWPLIVKPVDCYSSRGVKKVETPDQLAAAFKQAVDFSRTDTAIVEEFIDGLEVSADYYIENGQAKLLCCRVLDKIPQGDGFVICRGRYPAPLSEEMKAAVAKVGQQIAEAFSLKDTPMLIQMKVDGHRIAVIEFCARTGGGIKYRLLPRVSGFDVVEAVLELTLGNKPHCEPQPLNKYIIDEFLYCKAGTLAKVEGLEELLRDGVITHYDVFKAPGHSFKGIASSGDRVAYFSVEADTLEELEEKQKLANSRVKALSDTGEDLICHQYVEFLPY